MNEDVEKGFIYHESFFSRLRKSAVYVYTRTILLTVLFVSTFLFFVQISDVSGHSMDTTLHDGQIVLVNKKLYKDSDIKYGDIVVAKANFGNGNEQIIKRVIGKPGDILKCINGTMYRNGKKLNEKYIKEKMNKESWETKVDKNSLFLMGDNRNNSADSRVLGSVNYKKIVGKVFIFFP